MLIVSKLIIYKNSNNNKTKLVYKYSFNRWQFQPGDSYWKWYPLIDTRLSNNYANICIFLKNNLLYSIFTLNLKLSENTFVC